MKKLFLTLIFMSAFSVYAKTVDSTNVDSFKKTDEVLAEVVKKALTVAEKTGEFAIEQAPLLLKEFYLWHISECVLMILFWLIAFFLFQKINRLFSYGSKSLIPEENEKYYFLKKDGRYYYSSFKDGDCFAYDIISIFKIASYLLLIGVIGNIYGLVFILTAPKLYLIEYFVK